MHDRSRLPVINTQEKRNIPSCSSYDALTEFEELPDLVLKGDEALLKPCRQRQRLAGGGRNGMGRPGGFADRHGDGFGALGGTTDLKGDLGRGAELLTDRRRDPPERSLGR